MINTDSRFYILYVNVETNTTIDKLCVEVNSCNSSVFIPNIGETVLDKDNNIEYEVKDVLRTISGDEYGIQVRLRKREKNKYKN